MDVENVLTCSLSISEKQFTPSHRRPLLRTAAAKR